jgi:hypothetical protein
MKTNAKFHMPQKLGIAEFSQKRAASDALR